MGTAELTSLPSMALDNYQLASFMKKHQLQDDGLPHFAERAGRLKYTLENNLELLAPELEDW